MLWPDRAFAHLCCPLFFVHSPATWGCCGRPPSFPQRRTDWRTADAEIPSQAACPGRDVREGTVRLAGDRSRRWYDYLTVMSCIFVVVVCCMHVMSVLSLDREAWPSATPRVCHPTNGNTPRLPPSSGYLPRLASADRNTSSQRLLQLNQTSRRPKYSSVNLLVFPFHSFFSPFTVMTLCKLQ